MAVATTPTVNKLQLGKLVRHYRERAKFTQEQLGQTIFPRVSARSAQNKIALLESGQGGIHHAELAKLLEECGVTDADVLTLIDQMHANTSQRGRWSGYRAVYSETFRKYIDLEEDAELIQQTQVEVCPDLTHSEPYVRALFAIHPGEVEAAVQARLARGNLLREDRPGGAPPVKYQAVLSESCVRRVVGSREVLREQVAHLIDLSKLPNVALRIIPFDTPSTGTFATFNKYSLLTIPSPGLAGSLEFVYVNHGNDPRYMDDKAVVSTHKAQFDQHVDYALPTTDTRRYLQEVERDLRLG